MITRDDFRTGIRSARAAGILETLYGEEAVPGQVTRYERLAEAFFASSGADDAVFVSSPGRTELGGNHTDHNHGRVLCASVQLDALACAAPDRGDKVTVRSAGWEKPFVVDLSGLEPVKAEEGTTESLIRGVAACFRKRGYRIGGFTASMDSLVPPGSGLSSSASVEVLFGTIFNALYNDGTVPWVEIALMGREAENGWFGKPCGLMDQMACAAGGIITIDFADPAAPRHELVEFDFDEAGYALAVVDSGGSHADLTHEYAAIPEDMKAVAEIFGKGALRGVPADKLLARAAEIRAKAGDRALLRALHFARENERVPDMVDALRGSRLKRYLKLVRASGDSSWRLLQNVTAAGQTRDQSLAVAIELSREFLGKKGAVRVHGGGFAGTIQAYVPVGTKEKYERFMEASFGKGSVTWLRVRPVGAKKVF